MRKTDKEKCWLAVAGCLVWIHRIPKRKSLSLMTAYRNTLEKARGENRALYFICHQGPDWIAGRIAGDNAEIDDEDWDSYVELLTAKDPFATGCRLCDRDKAAQKRTTAAKAAKVSPTKVRTTNVRKKISGHRPR